MPATPGDGSRRTSRAPREWAELDTAIGFERCVRATLRELYGYVALLCGNDRREAERLVAGVYRSLFAAVQAGHVDSVTLGALRSAGRRVWLEAHRDELASIDEVSRASASTIAELSSLERSVLVLRYVNGMSVERCAAELGRSERDVAVLGAHAVRRLRGTDDTSGAWLRAYLGPTVTPAGGLVDRIVRHLGDGTRPAPAPPASNEMAPDETATDETATDETATDETATDETVLEQTVTEHVETDDGVDGDVSPDELPTTELAVVDRPTVELPAVELPDAADAADAEPDDASSGDASGLPIVADPEPEAGDPDGRRRRPTWVVVVGAVLVAGLVAALVWLALRGDADDTVVSAPSTTGAPVPSSTTPVATTTTSVPPTTVAAGAVELGVDPACVERGGAEPSALEWPDTFGALGAEPALVVSTPESVDVLADPERAPSRPEAFLRPDGLVVEARVAAGHRASQTIVSRVGLDGTVGWVRCLAGDVDVASRPDAGILAVRAVGDDGAWTSIAVSDGSSGEPLDDAQSAALDSRDAATPSGDGPTLGFSYDSGQGRTVPAGLDDGSVLWTASDVVLPDADGAFRAVQVDDVALVQSCAATDAGVDCAAGELRAYALGTGEVLWTRAGEHQVAASGDGLALVGDGSGWEIVDASTGDVVDGSQWDDPDTFAVDPTDGVSSVERVGGAVVVTRPGEVAVWLPADVTSAGAAVSLP